MKITREEMLEFMDNLALATVFDQKTGLTVFWNRSGDIPVAIRALIESSPEAGGQREPITTNEARTLLEKAGYETVPASNHSTVQGANVEVEAAMELLRQAVDIAISVPPREHDYELKLCAALATIRAALTEARQPKRVSRERAATFRQRAENSRNPK